ncbi:MAG: helix-turn-helix domain-containing protein [Nitrospiria bacterium]
MENLGEYLRQQREERNIPIEDLAVRTRIVVRFIRAIEENRFDLLPSPVSAKGFLRSYAQCLGLDETPILKAFAELVEPVEPASPLEGEEFPPYIQEELPDRLPFPSWAVLSVGALIVFLLILTVVLPKKVEEGELPPISPPVAPPPAAPIEETAPVDSPQALEPPAEEAEVPSEVDVPSDEESSLPEPKVIVPIPSPDPIPAEVREPSILFVEAIDSSWVQVTIDGDETKEALLQPSDTVRWRANEKFLLTLGNAGGVRVYLDGQDLGPLGPIGKVVRKEILVAEALPPEEEPLD